MKKNQLVVVVVVLVVLAAGAFYVSRKSNLNPVTATLPTVTPTKQASGSSQTTLVKEFTVDGSNYKFDPATITVKKEDRVKITFKDDDGRHNLVIDGFNVRTKTIPGGSQDMIEFTADKTGSFEYYCSVANHRELGMKGTLIVQ